MANKNILIERDIIKKGEGVAILDLEKYKEIERKIAQYEAKEKLLKSLGRFENLAKWGRVFAKRKRVSQKQVLEDD